MHPLSTVKTKGEGGSGIYRRRKGFTACFLLAEVMQMDVNGL